MSSYGADHINDFLRDFQGNSYRGQSTSSYTNPIYDDVPRQPMPSGYQSGWNPDDDTRDLVSQAGSAYTTNSSATSASRSRTATSVFSDHSSGRHRWGSASQTTAPSTRPMRQNLVQQVANTPGAGGASAFMLWCEFDALADCNERFRGDDIRGWIDHHERHHLQDRLPSQLLCWFCDDLSFVTDRGTDSRANFDRRMHHIHNHIFQDYKTVHDMRPDFYMVEHLYNRGFIDEDTYRLARGYSELPSALRLPGQDQYSQYSQSSNQGQPSRQLVIEPRSSRIRGQRHDIDAEERHRRREHRKR